MRTRALGIVAVVLSAATLAPAQPGEAAAVRVCAHPAPGFFTRDASGQPAGLEFDLLSGFGAATKRKVTFDGAPSFAQLLNDTEAGNCQIGASTVTVTEERRKRLQFSVPYFPNRIVVVQKTATGFARESDLKNQRVAVVTGTISERLVNAMPGVLPVPVKDDAAAFEALQKGEVHALACDSAVVLHHLGQNNDLGLAFPIGERSFFGFALPLDSKLGASLDQYLKGLVRSGEFAKILARHFGAANAEMLARDVAETIGK